MIFDPEYSYSDDINLNDISPNFKENHNFSNLRPESRLHSLSTPKIPSVENNTQSQSGLSLVTGPSKFNVDPF